ncbi:MAG: hypothetical protein AAGN46_06865 [Acidobacteriota bacterium]
MDPRLEPGAIVVAHLVRPTEKYWGLLHSIDTAGVALRAINLSSFDDWMRSAIYGEEIGLGLATIFFPLHRVERIFLDEPVGMVESMAQTFERRVGKSVQDFLDQSEGRVDETAN